MGRTQKSFQLNDTSLKVLEQYRHYCEEVNKKVGLPMATLSDNQLLNFSLSFLDVLNTRQNVFNVPDGDMPLFN